MNDSESHTCCTHTHTRPRNMTGKLALAMAGLALLTAGAGTAYAASQLPADSVSSAQVKDNSLTSRDVADNTLQLRDLAQAARAGLRGAPGPEGPRGARGPAGFVEGYWMKLINRDIALSNDGRRDIAGLLGLPAGSYAIDLTANIDSTSNGDSAVTCTLDARSDQVEYTPFKDATSVTRTDPWSTTAHINGIAVLGTGGGETGSISAFCRQDGANLTVSNIVFRAVGVDTWNRESF